MLHLHWNLSDCNHISHVPFQTYVHSVRAIITFKMHPPHHLQAYIRYNKNAKMQGRLWKSINISHALFQTHLHVCEGQCEILDTVPTNPSKIYTILRGQFPYSKYICHALFPTYIKYCEVNSYIQNTFAMLHFRHIYNTAMSIPIF